MDVILLSADDLGTNCVRSTCHPSTDSCAKIPFSVFGVVMQHSVPRTIHCARILCQKGAGHGGAGGTDGLNSSFNGILSIIDHFLLSPSDYRHGVRPIKLLWPHYVDIYPYGGEGDDRAY